jgi:hypothetical protein
VIDPGQDIAKATGSLIWTCRMDVQPADQALDADGKDN